LSDRLRDSQAGRIGKPDRRLAEHSQRADNQVPLPAEGNQLADSQELVPADSLELALADSQEPLPAEHI